MEPDDGVNDSCHDRPLPSSKIRFLRSVLRFRMLRTKKDLFLPDWHALNPGRVHIVKPEEEVHALNFPVRLYQFLLFHPFRPGSCIR